jgi:hypothetical protein
MGSIPIAGTPSLDVVGIGFSPSLGAFSENSSWPSIALKMRPNAGRTGDKRATLFWCLKSSQCFSYQKLVHLCYSSLFFQKKSVEDTGFDHTEDSKKPSSPELLGTTSVVLKSFPSAS